MQLFNNARYQGLIRSTLAVWAGGALTLGCLGLIGYHQMAYATALNDPGSRTAATGSGGLTPTESKVEAGEVTVGSTSQVVVRFRNDSSKDVKVGKIDLYPSSTISATIGLNECGKEPLPAGAECATVIAVKGVKTGSWRVEMLVRHDGKTKIVTAAIEGTVEAGEENSDKLLSDVETIPNVLEFGTLDASRPIVKSVILRNVTSDPIEVKNVSIEASAQSGYSLTTDCSKLAVGQACIATVTWSPAAKGKAVGVLMVEHDGPTKVASVDLNGDYAPKDAVKAPIFPEPVPGQGLMISSSETLDFGSVGNEASMTVSLVNVGDTEMKINDLSLGGVDNGLSISESGCAVGTVLEPIEACPLTVNWTPSKTGAILDDLQIRHDGARGVLVIPIRGTASGAVNKDTQAIVVRDGVEEEKRIDKSQALSGFVVTSHSSKKAIINGPGGSRVVTDGQSANFGGFSWNIFITESGIEFVSGKDKVKLPFDSSLSSVNRTTSVSGSGSGSSTAASSASSDTAAATATQ